MRSLMTQKLFGYEAESKYLIHPVNPLYDCKCNPLSFRVNSTIVDDEISYVKFENLSLSFTIRLLATSCGRTLDDSRPNW